MYTHLSLSIYIHIHNACTYMYTHIVYKHTRPGATCKTWRAARLGRRGPDVRGARPVAEHGGLLARRGDLG